MYFPGLVQYEPQFKEEISPVQRYPKGFLEQDFEGFVDLFVVTFQMEVLNNSDRCRYFGLSNLLQIMPVLYWDRFLTEVNLFGQKRGFSAKFVSNGGMDSYLELEWIKKISATTS